MGSIDKACISGFLCRLCSEMHRIVIHIYGDQGQRLCLVEKINGYLPITISPTDPLPKTICTTCLRRVEQHYDLLMRLSKIKEEKFLRVDKERRRLLEDAPRISSVETSDDEVYHSDDESRRRRQQDQTHERHSPQSQQQTLPLARTLTSNSIAPSSSLSAVVDASFSTASITTDSNSENVDSPENENGNADESAASVSALTTLTRNLINIAASSASTSSNHTLSVELDQSVTGGNSFGIVSQQNND